LKDLDKKDSEMEDDGKKRDFEKAQDVLACAKNKKDLSEQANKSVSTLARIVKERVEIAKNEIRKKESGQERKWCETKL